MTGQKKGGRWPPVYRLGIGLLFRADHHDHLAAFQTRHGFEFAIVADIGGDAVQQFQTQPLVGHFTAPKAQGDLDLVAFLRNFRTERIFTS